MNIGVFGSSTATNKKIIHKCAEIGTFLASQKHAVFTGGVSGYPYLVATSAIESGGRAVAYCAGLNLSDHKKFYPCNLSKFTKVFEKKYFGKKYGVVDLYARSLNLCFKIDKAIVIGGRVGTMYETMIVNGLGKDIYILENSGGISKKTLKYFSEEGHKGNSKILWFKNTDELKKMLTSD